MFILKEWGSNRNVQQRDINEKFTPSKLSHTAQFSPSETLRNNQLYGLTRF